MTYRIDVPGLVQFLGGPKQIEQDQQAAGIQDPVSSKTVEKWRERGTVPMQRFLDLMAIAEKNGQRLEIRNFMQRRHLPPTSGK